MSRRMLLTTEPIWFSFTVKILIGPGKVTSFLEGVYTLTLPGEINHPWNPPPLLKNLLFLFKTKFQNVPSLQCIVSYVVIILATTLISFFLCYLFAC